MTVLEIPSLRRNDPQLLGKVSQDIGLDIIPPGRKSRPFSKKAQLKRKPDPARPIDRLDQTDVIKGQAPNLDKRPFQFAIPHSQTRDSQTRSNAAVNSQPVR
jgi:hypothetical protein